MRKSTMLTLFIGLVFLSSCSHSLKIQNLGEYYNSYSFNGKKVKIGLVMNTNTPVEERHAEEIAQSLRSTGNFDIIFPYNPSNSGKVDYVFEIAPKVVYDGSKWNFLISFPGFLVFAPAWNGYLYFANIDTEITIKKNNVVAKKTVIPFNLRVNQADFGRTWAVGLDWLVTIGVASLIGGFFFTSFDDDIQGELFRTYVNQYGKYIANKISADLSAL
ncbi:hypothetical protein AB3N59_07735 [Leptospira sp. WS92.C1]